MKPSLTARIPNLLDNAKSKRSIATLLILFVFFLVSWATAATPFGSRGSLSGDDWYFLANIILGEFPACIGSNSINPWRPFQPSLYCALYQIVGPNLPLLYTITAFVLTFIAFAWYGIVRNVFKLSRWMAFAVGLIFLAYPDHLFRLSMIEGIRLVGPLATLCGIWAVLIFWEQPRKMWLLVVACLLALYGQLTYETLIAAWAIGLPLALLYKSSRLSWRWLRVSLVIELVTISYFIWRYLILPTTYTEKTLIAGAHNPHLTLGTLLEQARNSFLYAIAVWPKNVDWFNLYQTQNSGANALLIVGISLVVGLLTLWGLYTLYRLDRGRMEESTLRWRDVFGAAVLLVVIMALPFYVLSLDWMVDTYHSFGTPFAASVGLVSLLWLILRQQRTSFRPCRS